MSSFYDRYQQVFHQEVYDELLAKQEQIYEPQIQEDVFLVMRELMRRVRTNIELLLPRLSSLGYQFRRGGFWENVSPEECRQLLVAYPIFQLPTAETREHVAALEQLAGPLPLSLKCFFEEVGSVNFIGLFPLQQRHDGTLLDPLCVASVEVALQMVTSLKHPDVVDLWEEEPMLILAGDRFHKYGYSGSGGYSLQLPCRALDALFVDEPHGTTFVNYLRICMQWGGFPGFEQECPLTQEEFAYLTKDLLPF